MRRYWIDPDFKSGDHVVISGDTFHHIFDVCRQDRGSQFEVLLGDQKAYLVEVTEISKKSAICKVLRSRAVEPISKPYIEMYVALPRLPTFESVLEKAVELGVIQVTPFINQNSFIKSKNEIKESKWERWQKIITSATQQSGRGDRMELKEILSFSELTETLKSKLVLFAYEGEATKSVKDHVTEMKKSNPERIAIIVGSEGGFSDSEVRTFMDNNVTPVTLGPQVLRVETAAIALLAAVKFL